MNKFEHKWNLYKGAIHGKQYSMRVIQLDYKKISSSYPYKAGIAIPLNWSTENGMPSSVEMESLNKIEDYLDETIDSNKDVLVAVVTGDNVIEFVFYTADPENLATLYKKKIEKHIIDDHKSQFYVKEDKNWTAYLSLKGE